VPSISNFYLRCKTITLVDREHEFAVAFDDGALYLPDLFGTFDTTGRCLSAQAEIGKTSALRTEIAPAKGRSEGMEAGRREDDRSWEQESAER
jgi:hypothetical protein